MTYTNDDIGIVEWALDRLPREEVIAEAWQRLRARLYQAPPARDEALADTQRAIIEAAERRGYERRLKEEKAAAVPEPMPGLDVGE